MKKILLLAIVAAAWRLPVGAQTPITPTSQEVWPEVPTAKEPQFTSSSSSSIKKFFPRQAGFPFRDASHTETTDNRFRGILVYTPVAGPLPYGERFIVLRALGQKKKADEQFTDVISYRADFKPADNLHTPVLSLDGRKLLFQQGTPFGSDEDAGSWSYMYCWDFDKKQWGFYALSGPSVVQSWATDNLHFMQHIEQVPADEAWRRTENTEALIFDVRDRVTKEAQNSVPAYRSPRTFSSRITRWTNQGTVMGTQEAKTERDQPSAVEWIPYTQKINVLSSDAFDPCPSPDGQFIAYFGWPGKDKNANPLPVFAAPPELALPDIAVPQTKPADFNEGGPFLYLLDRKSGRKSIVNTQSSAQLAWTGDGQNLIVVAKTYGADKRQVETHIKTISLVQMTGDLPPNVPRQIKEVATLSATDFTAMQRAVPPNFRVMSVARHGKENWLYVDVSEYTGQGLLYTEEKRIEAINLGSGEDVTLSRLTSVEGSVVGWDWHDDADETVRPIVEIKPPPTSKPAPAKKPETAPPKR